MKHPQSTRFRFGSLLIAGGILSVTACGSSRQTTSVVHDSQAASSPTAYGSPSASPSTPSSAEVSLFLRELGNSITTHLPPLVKSDPQRLIRAGLAACAIAEKQGAASFDIVPIDQEVLKTMGWAPTSMSYHHQDVNNIFASGQGVFCPDTLGP